MSCIHCGFTYYMIKCKICNDNYFCGYCNSCINSCRTCSQKQCYKCNTLDILVKCDQCQSLYCSKCVPQDNINNTCWDCKLFNDTLDKEINID